MRAFFRGFKYAFCGLIHCIKNERNMRIHTVAAVFVLIFARFFAFTKTDYAILLLTIGSVISAEAFNTAIESLADRVSMQKHPLIRAAKDTAAGAVLAAAIFSVGIAVCLFGDADGFRRIFDFYMSNPLNLGGIAALAVLSVIYVVIIPYGKEKNVKTKNNIDNDRSNKTEE